MIRSISYRLTLIMYRKVSLLFQFLKISVWSLKIGTYEIMYCVSEFYNAIACCNYYQYENVKIDYILLISMKQFVYISFFMIVILIQ